MRSHSSLQKGCVSLFRKPVSWIWISLIFGYRTSTKVRSCVAGLTNKLGLFDEIVTGLDHNVVFVAENGGDLVRDPFLDQVNVDLLDVDFLVKFGWELGRLEALLVDAHSHVSVCCGCGLNWRVDDTNLGNGGGGAPAR